MSAIDGVSVFFRGVSPADPARATGYMNPAHYVEHNPRVANGGRRREAIC